MVSDFDKYQLIPQYSEMESRNNIDLSSKFTRGMWLLKYPLVSSPMNSVTEMDMALEMARLGGLGVIHRYMTPEEQANQVIKIKEYNNILTVGASIGVNNQEKRIDLLYKAGVNVLTLDVAHGDMKACYDLVKYIKNKDELIQIVSGNIVTVQAAQRYYDAGVDSFRVGIGSGSGCITRTVAGVGYNQLDSIKEIRERFPEIPIISDGGIRNSGDIIKALSFGADSVFIGGLFAPTNKSSAERYSHDRNFKDGHGFAYNYGFCGKCKDLGIRFDKVYVRYMGMASKYAEEKRIERTGEDSRDIIHLSAPEGREVFIEDTGETTETMFNRLVSGIKIGLAYMGSENVLDLRKKVLNGAYTKI